MSQEHVFVGRAVQMTRDQLAEIYARKAKICKCGLIYLNYCKRCESGPEPSQL